MSQSRQTANLIPSTSELIGVDTLELGSLSDETGSWGAPITAVELAALDMPDPAAISKSILVTDKVNCSRIRCDSMEPVLDSLWIRRTVEAETRSSGWIKLYKW